MDRPPKDSHALASTATPTVHIERSLAPFSRTPPEVIVEAIVEILVGAVVEILVEILVGAVVEILVGAIVEILVGAIVGAIVDVIRDAATATTTEAFTDAAIETGDAAVADGLADEDEPRHSGGAQCNVETLCLSFCVRAEGGRKKSIILPSPNRATMIASVLSQVDQSSPIRIMVLDDEPAIGRAVQRNLTSERFKVELEYEVAPVLARLQAGHGDWDVFILDINLRGDIDGFEVLHHLKRASARTSVVMISGNDSANTAAACLRAGAFDYLTKPIRHTELSAAVSKAASHAFAQRATLPPSDLGDDPATAALIGTSATIHQLRSRIRQVSALPTSILIQGETGTGKELVARAIHAQSERKHHRFVPLNCAAIPEGLIDSALFGHSRGAFTGATENHPGAFVEANNGTLFLDEIGDMALSAQVRLLRAVQEFEVRAVGSTNVRRVDVRLISATNVDLQAAARDEKFRADLLYRLDVFRLTVPPLRERLEDIPELVAHFIHKHGVRTAKRSKAPRPLPAIHQSTLEVLMLCDWPGNVRQLENAIQSALAMCEGPIVLPSHLPDWVTPRSMIASPGSWRTPSEDHRARPARGTDHPGEPATIPPPVSSEHDPDTATELAFGPETDLTAFEVLLRNEFGKLVDLEGDKLPHISEFSHKIMWLLRRNYLHLLMSRVAGNLTQAARVAGVDRANLRRLLRAHGLNASDYRAKPDDKN